MEPTTLHLFSDDDQHVLEIHEGLVSYRHISTSEQLPVKVSQLTVEGGVHVATALTDLQLADVAEREARISSLTELDDLLSASIASEQTRAQAAELASSTAIQTHATLREQGDVAVAQVLSAQVTAERARAELVEAGLSTQVTGDLATRVAEDVSIRQELAAERGRALAAESATQSLTALERGRALAAEALLSARLATEQGRASAAEAALQTDLAAQAASLSQESARATGQAALLTASLAGESTRALAAELLQSNRSQLAEVALADQLAFLTSNVDPAALDSLTEIVAQANVVDTSLFGRIFTLESFIKSTFDLESLYPLKIEDMQQRTVSIVDSGPLTQGAGVPVGCPGGGWAFQNAEHVTQNQIRWKLHSPLQPEALTGFYARVDLKSVEALPFFSVNGGEVVYMFTETPLAGPVLMFVGQDLPAIYPDIPHIQLGLLPDLLLVASVSLTTPAAAAKNTVDLCVTDFVVGNGKHTHVTLDETAPPPAPSTTTIHVSQTAGNYPSENSSFITTEPGGAGEVIWAQSGTGVILEEAVEVPTGVELYFNAYDSYGDGWNNATYQVRLEGVVVIDNGGLSPAKGSGNFDPLNPHLETTESFIIN